MSTRRKRFVVVWSLVFGVFCSHLFAQSETAMQPKGSPIITLNWTQCYGTCPDYTVSIFEDGQFIYEGGVYVKVKGLASGAISKKQLKQLTDKFQKVGFFDMLGTVQRASLGCSPMATDLPTLTISFRQSNRLKTIRQYTGCLGLNKRFVAETKDLYDLDRLIKKAVEIERFIGTDEERKNIQFGRPIK